MNIPINLITVSEKLLLAVKIDDDTQQFENQLANCSMEMLQQQVNGDEAKKTFWINCYNAYFQLFSKRENLSRNKIFNTKFITIAGTKFCLDDIEHGILRKGRWKWSFGYLSHPFTPSLMKELAVKNVDYRIHFALNCGAKSCPTIAFYTCKDIDEQLKEAMEAFIMCESRVNEPRKTVSTSKLFYWYRADFGGFFEIKKILGKVLNQKVTGYKLSFNKYNWETQLNNYKTN